MNQSSTTIGLPRAFLYYRCATLWKTFFQELGCAVLESAETCRSTWKQGNRNTVGPCCLPFQIFLGHVWELIGLCDYILVPRFQKLGRDEEFCTRYMGLYDIVCSTYPQAALLDYNLNGKHSERTGFIRMGLRLGCTARQALHAYGAGKQAQSEAERLLKEAQDLQWEKPQLKILLAAQPYLLHDPYIGGQVQQLLREQGGLPLFSDRCDRERCQQAGRAFSAPLYWTLNREEAGAVLSYRQRVDGVILLTAFPCGTNAMVNELLLRQKQATPTIQVFLDELQGLAGLQTRIESFMDILQTRRQTV